MSSKYSSKSRTTENITVTEYNYNINTFFNALDIEGNPTNISIDIEYENSKPSNIRVVTKQ